MLIKTQRIQHEVHTASQVLQVSVDDDEETFVDGGDEFGETMPWFTKDVGF